MGQPPQGFGLRFSFLIPGFIADVGKNFPHQKFHITSEREQNLLAARATPDDFGSQVFPSKMANGGLRNTSKEQIRSGNVVDELLPEKWLRDATVYFTQFGNALTF